MGWFHRNHCATQSTKYSGFTGWRCHTFGESRNLVHSACCSCGWGDHCGHGACAQQHFLVCWFLWAQRWSQEYCILWKKLGGSRCDQVDKVNNPMHDFLLNGCFAKLLSAFQAKRYDVAFFAPPCHQFTICRFRYMSGFPILRPIFDIMGSKTTGAHLVAVSAVNTIIEYVRSDLDSP